MAIVLGGQAAGRRQGDAPEMVLGGYTALAESAWMGAAQASDVLESLRSSPAGRTRRPVLPRLPRLRLAGLLTREFSIAEATFILMASFLVSAVLGAVRQILFNAAFGAAAGALTYQVLVAYAVALPFYVATEVITRGLIALDDTRTPLLTNTAQIAGRALLALLIAPIGVLAIPIAFAVTASLETLLLGVVLLIKLRRLNRQGARQ